jgi:suppressor of ftsI
MNVARISSVSGMVFLAVVLLGTTAPAARVAQNVAPGVAPITGGNLAVEPSVIPHDGVTSLTLTARTNAAGRDYYEYLGQSMPPVIHVVPGGRLNVHFVNQMNPLAKEKCVVLPCRQDTNLHFHGLEVSPRPPADDVLTMLTAPGQSLDYTVPIPKIHPAGLFWYHPHPHGESTRQVEDGMAGAIVVDGIERYVPQVRTLRERVLVFRDHGPSTTPMAVLQATFDQAKVAVADLFGGGTDVTQTSSYCSLDRASPETRARFAAFIAQAATAAPAPPAPAPAADTHCSAVPEQPDHLLPINGTIQPTIDIAPGERQFWRILNASEGTFLDLDLGSPFEIVALDGVPLAVRYGRGNMQRVSHLVIPPAGRLEAIVTGPPAGANRVLLSHCIDLGPDGDPNPEMILAQLGSGSGGPARTVASEVRTMTPLAGEPPGVAAAELRKPTEVITFTENDLGFYVNGRPFNPLDGPVIRAKVGDLEHWRIVNNTHEVHPFHIHQIHFLPFTSTSGGKRTTPPTWLDTFDVAPESTIELVMDFTNPAIKGLAVLHCHILSHEDKGMMAKVLFQ